MNLAYDPAIRFLQTHPKRGNRMSSQRIEHKCAQQLGSPWPRSGNHHQAHKRVMGKKTWARHAARYYSAINKREVLPPTRRGPISETSCGVEVTGPERPRSTAFCSQDVSTRGRPAEMNGDGPPLRLRVGTSRDCRWTQRMFWGLCCDNCTILQIH